MDTVRRRALIEEYRGGVAAVERALDGISDDELDRTPDGEWSPRMVVHHLADSETNSYLRLRKLLAENDTTIQGYDEAEFARVLHYDRPIERSLEVFRAVRNSSSELLDELGEDDWSKAGTHSESGAYSVDGWLEIYADHAVTHADQIARARSGVA
jgi:DinB superfamily